MSDWAQYADTTERGTYPPLPTRGGDTNKEASEQIVGAIASQHAVSVQQEAAFRARQRARRLLTRGAAAMRDPEERGPVGEADPLPDDPALAEYKAAGWVA